MLDKPEYAPRWTRSTPEGRWCGFGPYYAMFPVEFVRHTVSMFCPPGGKVIDPFCGRGTTPFVAQATGREALGADINPVAWIFADVKLNPYSKPDELLERIRELLSEVSFQDIKAENSFQRNAWSPNVLGFLRSARRSLDWRVDWKDRTLMALILVHLHAKLGEGLSNQLRQSKAMSPDYSVRWWQDKGLKPPEIDIIEFFKKKIAWRFEKGAPRRQSNSRVFLGDAITEFDRVKSFGADLILTSPPYCGVTNYEYDNWIRYWMLGGPPLPSHNSASRFTNKKKYKALIENVLRSAERLSKKDANVYIRTSAKEFSAGVAIDAIQKLWPNHSLACRFDIAPGPTQTALYGNAWQKDGEVDFLAYKNTVVLPTGFESLW